MNDNINKFNLDTFQNLALIPELLEKLNMLHDKLLHLEKNLIVPLDLTTRKNVKKYLDISESTLNNMINDGRLKKNIHYVTVIKNGRVRFVFKHNAIKEFTK